ncbi:MAG: ATP-binding cassette domain-containing protein [Terriglobales bacterium]
MDTAPALELDSVSKLFGRVAALREVTASFVPGRLYGIFGENGAGKTTLLRLVAGLARPTRGRILRWGSDDLHPALARLGYMAHASLLYDELTGLENLRYFARLYASAETLPATSPAPSFDDSRLKQVISDVGLDPGLSLRVGDYSQGMRQRLSLARALLHGPDLLLLDEPFSNVDTHSAAAMATRLGRLRDSGKTIFVVTHQAAHLEAVADESLWIAAGEVAARQPGVRAALTAPAVQP